MALTFTDRGTGGNNSTATTIVITPATDLAAGSTGIIAIAMDNANAASSNLTSAPYTDTAGNVWYVVQDTVAGTANSLAEAVILKSLLTANFTTSKSLTVSLAVTCIAKAWAIVEVIPGTAGTVALLGAANTVAAPASSAPSIITTELSNGHGILGIGFSESDDQWAGDADTTNGSWSTMQHAGFGTGAAGMSILTQTKVCNAYGLQTFNPTLTNPFDCKVTWMQFVEADPKARTLDTQGNTVSSTTATFRTPMAAGSMAVLCISADNMGTNGSSTNFPSSLSDSKSNTWTLQYNDLFDNGIAGAGVELAVYTSVLTTPLAIGDTVTWTYTIANVPVKCWAVWEFAPQNGGAMSFVGFGTAVGSTTGSPTVTTSLAVTANDYIIGLCGLESGNSFAGDAGTTNGTWKTALSTGNGTSGTNAMSLCTQWKQVTATATQTYNPTCTSADTKIGYVTITEVVPPAGGFFMFMR